MKDKLKRSWYVLKNSWLELKDIFSKNEIEKENKKEKIFNSLAPTSLNPKESSTYLKALNTGILDKTINNIALTGSYGSGKSSLIKTFEENSEYKFLKISLASFDDTNNHSDKANLERQIELSILQQIFYHVKADKIPDSRFKRIKNITRKQLITFSLCFSLWLLSSLIIFSFDYLEKLNPTNWTLGYQFDYLAFVIFLIFFSGIAVIAKSVIRFFNNSKISKVSLKGELEVGKDIDKSILNQYLDELIYFFERNHYDIVVIEDLDRFNSVEIFTKLREINTLINNSQQKKGDVVFLYAIRDDIFTGKDRTKFFDFILPVIPVINKSNSNEKLKERLASISTDNMPTDEFIDDVALFIDDMRLLNNICNEYVIYKNNLSSKLIQDKLFAMIVYKNMRPDDFVDLHNGRGKLFNLLNDKKIYITEAVSQLDNSIEECESEIEKIENENFENTLELRAVYINKLQSIYSDVTSMQISGKQLSFGDLEGDEEFELLRNNENYTFNQYQHNYRQVRPIKSNKKFKDIENEVDNKNSYEERLKLIENKSNYKIQDLKREIEDLKESKDKINSYTLKGIFKEFDPLTLISEDVKKDKLTIFLLRNGYIDENYYDYISYFHEVSITRQDFEFLQSIKSQIPNDFDYKLNKIGTLIGRINKDYFREPTILNFDLIDYLLVNEFKNKDKLDLLLTLFKTKNNRAIIFFEEYIDKGKEVQSFFKILSNKWKGLWKHIDAETKFTEEKKNKCLKLICENSNVKDIWSLSLYSDSSLKKYLSDNENALTYISSFKSEKKTKEIIDSLDLEFKYLKLPNKDEELLFDYIYKNSFYRINSNNIELLLKWKNSKIKVEDIRNSNYTNILNSKKKELIENVENSIESYIDNVYLELEENFYESEEAIIRLLNKKELDNNKKREVIDHNLTKIVNLNKIDDIEIKEILLEQDLIEINWRNILSYYKSYDKNNLDSILVDYLNKEDIYLVLGKSEISNAEGDEKEELIKEFSIALLSCDDLELDAFKQLVSATPYKWKSLNFETLDKNKVEWLISSKILSLSSKNFDKLKDNFPNLNTKLVELNFHSFMRTFDDYELDEEEIFTLLNSDDLSLVQKNELINKYEEEFILNSDSLPAIVAELLSQHKYKSLSFDYLNGLFSSTDSNLHKIRLINQNAESLNSEQITQLVAKLTYPYGKLLENRKRTRLKVTNENLEFIDILLDKGIISSKDVDKHRIKVISKY